MSFTKMAHKSIFAATIVLAFVGTKILCRATFRISKFNQCPPKESKFLTVPQLTLEKCVEECSSRKSCMVVGYKRLYHLCELHTLSALSASQGQCVTVDRKDMYIQNETGNTGTSVACNEWEVVEMTEDGIKCVKKDCDPGYVKLVYHTTFFRRGLFFLEECGPQTFQVYKKYLGNMNQVGSKKAIICSQDEQNTKYLKCMADGNWHDVHPANVKCPAGTGDWVRLKCTEILIRTEILTHLDAQTTCKTFDANLVKIDQQWKLGVIMSMLQTCPGLSGGQYWVDGFQDAASKNAWKFSDGSLVPMGKYFWKDHAPDNIIAGGACIRMVRHDIDDVGDHRFDDVMCDRTFGFICERPVL